MKIVIFTFKSHKYHFLGSERLFSSILKGLRFLGHNAKFVHHIDEVHDADFVLLSNSCSEHARYYHALKLLNKPFGFIPFFDDFLKFDRAMRGFFYYISAMLLHPSSGLDLDFLLNIPEAINYSDIIPHNIHLVNYQIYKDAAFSMVNSPTEGQTLKDHFPLANIETIFLAPGQMTEKEYAYSKEFLKYVPELTKGSYILQIGRLEARKNQLASILATRNCDIPLVFITSDILQSALPYVDICIKAIAKWRKAPTYILSHFLKPYEDGLLKIIKIPKSSPFDANMLASAYQNAGLYLHPAFSELPGYVYLEAAKLGTPIVASSWTTIKDYFTNKNGEHMLDNQISYIRPHHLLEIESAVEKQFGKKIAIPKHAILQRTNLDVAKELLVAIEKTK